MRTSPKQNRGEHASEAEVPESLERYFEPFRRNIIGWDMPIETAAGTVPLLYADWAASGRLYRPIEQRLAESLGPFMANPHTETTTTGRIVTEAYEEARSVILRHVHASEEDALLFVGFGMTAAINRFIRILGLRLPSSLRAKVHQKRADRPVVFITHMEHHSNQIPWEEGLCDVRIVRRGEEGLPDLNHLETLLKTHRHRPLIGSFTACSNVTGLLTPVQEMARLMHRFGGLCFVDYSASAPYVSIDMHPTDPEARIDAVFFSPHKFLGGPGSSGVLIFNRGLYQNSVPDHPGGGTVLWTNPWGGHRYVPSIVSREEGGTPGVLQGVKAALAVRLKEAMGVSAMAIRERELTQRLMGGLDRIPGVRIFERHNTHRLGFVSFLVEGVHHSLVVRLLDDRFGIQTRGGCSCAGTLGHLLLGIDPERSRRITDRIDRGDLSQKPGWIRVSLHPVMTDHQIDRIVEGIREVVTHHKAWARGYRFDSRAGDFKPIRPRKPPVDIGHLFSPSSIGGSS